MTEKVASKTSIQVASKRQKQIHKATHSGELKVGDAIIPCAVLEDGTRVLTQSGFLTAIGRSRTPKAGTGATVAKVPIFWVAGNLKPFIDKDLLVSTMPIKFQYANGREGIGYKAEILPKVCEVFLKARDAEALQKKQIRYASACDLLMRGLAHVGITALVDEATGYQANRARDALERILEEFIAKEYRKWLKTFPDDFYKEMFRLKKWAYDSLSVERPALVGKYTNDLVYERLAPGVLEELRNVNPKTQSGNRKHKHFQWLTDDIGHPKLREHLGILVALMKACDTWEAFKRAVNRALPKPHSQIELIGPGFDGLE